MASCSRSVAISAIAACCLFAHAAHAQKSFFIDETTNYYTCYWWMSALTDSTTPLYYTLYAHSWWGEKYLNQQAWPQDFWEGTLSGGLDGYYADNHLLCVFSGHSDVNHLYWGYPHDGQCPLEASTQLRLGTLAGDKCGYAMYLACCFMNLDHISNLFPNQTNQQFGFHSAAMVDDDMPANFFTHTQWPGYNTLAWLVEMEHWYGDYNSPVVLSYGVTLSQASLIHNGASLHDEVYLWYVGEPADYYVYSYYDHGDYGC